MSWIVENLLRHKVQIETEPDLESDQYNDLLVIISKIIKLHEDGVISDKEMELIEYVSDGKRLDEVSGNLTNTTAFTALCNKISLYVGGYFTDDGYFQYMKNKYKLTDEQVKVMREYASGRFRHRVKEKRNKKINDS